MKRDILVLVTHIMVAIHALYGQHTYTYMELERAKALLLRDKPVPKDSLINAKLVVSFTLQNELKLDSALLLAEEAVAMAEEEKDTLALANACFQRAKSLFRKAEREADPVKAMESLQEVISLMKQAIALGKKAKDHNMVVGAYKSLAVVHTNHHIIDPDTSLRYYETGLAYAKKYGDATLIAESYVDIADHHAWHGQIQISNAYLDSLRTLLAEVDSANRDYIDLYLYSTECMNAMRLEDMPRAVAAGQKAVFAAERYGDVQEIITMRGQYARCWTRLGIGDSALNILYGTLELVEGLSRENPDLEVAAYRVSVHQVLAKTLWGMKNTVEAKRHQHITDSLIAFLPPPYQAYVDFERMVLALEVGEFDRYKMLYDQADLALLRSLTPMFALSLKKLEARAAYIISKDYRKAIRLQEKLRQETSDENDLSKITLIDSYYHTAKCYLFLGEPRKALEMVSLSEPLMSEYKQLSHRPKIYILAMQAARQLQDAGLAEAFEKKYEEALSAQSYAKYNMASQMAETQYRTANIKAERDLQAKERQLAEQRSAQNLQLALIAALGLAILAIFSVFLYRGRQEQKRLATLNEDLYDELNHRTANNIHQVAYLLETQSRQIVEEAAKDALKDSEQRVKTVSILHRTLLGDGNKGEINVRDYLHELVHSLLSAYGIRHRELNLHLNLTDVEMDVSKGMPLGLIVNEWVTNALKYALSGAKHPYLGVSFQLIAPQKAELIVEDHGPGLPYKLDLATSDSYGLNLVYKMCQQLFGEVELSREKGTRWRLVFKYT